MWEQGWGFDPPPVEPEGDGPVLDGVVSDDSSGGFALGGGDGDVWEAGSPSGDGEAYGGGEAAC